MIRFAQTLQLLLLRIGETELLKHLRLAVVLPVVPPIASIFSTILHPFVHCFELLRLLVG